MKRIATITALAALALCSFSLSASDGLKKASPKSCGMDAAQLQKIDGVVEKHIADKTIPGAVVSVVRGDKIVYLKAYGNKQVVPDTVAMTTDAVFDLASVSKCIGTTLSFMQLIENGQVRLIDNVNRYIPDFAPWVDPETGEKVNIEIQDLLTHSSGLSPYTSADYQVKLYGANQPDSLMRFIATKVKRNFRPKTDHMYSCLNFITLQNVLQNITGEKLCDYAQKHVYEPMGLKHTCYKPTGETLAMCVPTEVQANGLPLIGEVHDPLARICNGGNSGNAGVFSNAEDLSVIAAALMNGGTIHGHRLMSPLMVKTMSTIPSNNAPHVGTALGFDNSSDMTSNKGDLFSREHTICHTGYTGTSIVIDLENNVAVIVLTNRVHPTDKGSVSRLRSYIANIVAASVIE